jgi:hypothetical protein
VDDATVSASGRDHPVFNIARLQRSLRGSSKIGLVYTDRIDGGDSNRVLAADARLLFGSIYSLQLQAGGSRTHASTGTTSAPIWRAVLNRDGRHFGYRYQAVGVHEDFRAASGFINRGGIMTADLTHRGTWFGGKDSTVQSFTSSVLANGVRQYRNVTSGDPWLEKKLHFNNTVTWKGGWQSGASALFESFAFDEPFYGTYGLLAEGADAPILPFTGVPHLHNADYVLTLNTPQFSKFSGSIFQLWGRDENFFEWSSANILFSTYAADWRPSTQLRINAQYQVQGYRRRTDGTTVAIRRTPRLRVEYQMTRSIFLRAIGEYDASRQDDLRDDSRTNLPIVIRDPATGAYARALASERNRFRIDALFSYQPTPGTVVFAGYGSMLTEPHGLQFADLHRTTDGFFVKISYLFRL